MEEDKDCFVEYIEIVPLDNFNNCSDDTNIKQEPVCSFFHFARLHIYDG